MADGRVPVRESVGAALRFVRETWQPIAVVSAIGAVVLTILSVLSTTVPALSLPVTIATTFANAFVYAAFISACLAGAPGLAQRIGGDGMRVWGAMAVVGFFLLIVFVVLGIPGIIVFAVMVAGRYATELQAVQGDEAQMATLIQRIFTENPGILLGFLIFYGALWFALTSRLYLAAPASVDAKRILSFETWAWTKNNMLRILGARLMLLLPAYILAAGVSYLIASAIGLNPSDPTNIATFAQQSAPLFAIYVLVSNFIQFALYGSLEAGLSTYLYRGLKPAAQPPPV